MNFVPRKLRHTILLASLTAALAACGGGGGGSAGTGGGSGQPPAGEHYAVLTWEAPVTREDGTCLDELAAYEVSYGLSSGVYEKTEKVEAAKMSSSATGRSTDCGDVRSYSYLVDNLSPASWYFAVRAVDKAGNRSDYSNEAITTVQ